MYDSSPPVMAVPQFSFIKYNDITYASEFGINVNVCVQKNKVRCCMYAEHKFGRSVPLSRQCVRPHSKSVYRLPPRACKNDDERRLPPKLAIDLYSLLV